MLLSVVNTNSSTQKECGVCGMCVCEGGMQAASVGIQSSVICEWRSCRLQDTSLPLHAHGLMLIWAHHCLLGYYHVVTTRNDSAE